jgi:hypothetical protein
MPTIHREDGFRFFFYSEEGNEPAHVHIIGHGGEAKIWLEPLQFSRIRNLSPKHQRKILEITMKNKNTFLRVWRKYHE